MKSTFSRALVGFATLSFGVWAIASVAFWGIERFAGGVWWASLITLAVALVSQIGVYADTLHKIVRDWITEPQRAAERAVRKAEAEADKARIDARYADQRRAAELAVQQRAQNAFTSAGTKAPKTNV